jgi:aryl-alcohol dehydrogenase-like predicted oxidoreductase
MTRILSQRPLGRTGIMVSELGFGAGGYWGMKVFSESKARQLVDIALERGVTFFDTGPNYSGGNAEPRLGRILQGRTEGLLIGTKVGTRLVNGRHVKDYSPAGIEQSVTESLRNLRLEQLPLLQLHGFPKAADAGVEKVLSLKERGLVRLVGVSTDGKSAQRAVSLGVFDVLMTEYNVVKRDAPAAVIADAARRGMGVLVKSPLAHTLYSDRIFRVRKPSDVWYLARALKTHRHKLAAARRLGFINHVEGFTGAGIALSYVLRNSDVSCAVTGTVSPDHLRANIGAAAKVLPAELLERINRS